MDDDLVPWEFDETVRGRSSFDMLLADDSDAAHSVTDVTASPNPTIRPPQSKVPPALRMLFHDEDNSDPFKIPGFEPPTGASLLPLPPLLAPPRGRGRSKSATSSQPSDQEEEVLTAKQPTFEFPPRSSTPLKVSKEKDDNDGASKRERLPPLGAGMPRSVTPLIDLDSEPSNEPSLPIDSDEPWGDEILPPNNAKIVTTPLSEISAPGLVSISPVKQSPRAGIPATTRQHSKGVANSPDTDGPRREWRFPTKEFQFPPPGFASDSTLSTKTKTHNRISPTHASASTISSTINSSRSSHQFTQSLDASAVPRRLPSPVGLLPVPANMNRSRSATPFGDTSPSFSPSSAGPFTPSKHIPQKPSMTRLASVAVMETVQTPLRSFSRNKGSRSGSLSDADPPLPGLRDVLKVFAYISGAFLYSLTMHVDPYGHIRA